MNQPPYGQQPPPYGQPPGYGAPGAPPPQQWAPRPPMPQRPSGGGLPIMMLIRLGVAGVAILFAGGVFLFMKFKMGRDAKPHVVFENSTASAVELEIDGKSQGQIAANAGKVVILDPGPHDVVAGSDKGHIEVPSTDSFRGLYAIGGKSLVAVVTVHYSSGSSSSLKDTITPVEFKGSNRLATLSGGLTPDNMELDKSFPEEVSVNQGSLGTSITHLCHIHDADDDYVGCPNF